jgi:CO/xanthine dehydrogenase Mo-binding subunit
MTRANPEAAERQIRGTMAWSLGPAFNPEISFGTGLQSRLIWILRPTRMNEFPGQISINHIKTDRWISGIRQEPVPVVALATLNAAHMATGKRMRLVPIAKPRLELHLE